MASRGVLQCACLKFWQQTQKLPTSTACIVLLKALQGALQCAQLPRSLLLDVEASSFALLTNFLIPLITPSLHHPCTLPE